MGDLTGWDRQRLQKALGKTAGDRIADFYDNLDTLSTAELGAIDGVTAGTAAAGKAVVLDSSGEVDTIGFSGPPTTSSGVGAKNGATVVATEYGDGVFHQTLLTCTATPLAFGDEGGDGQFGGVKVYDFPAGLLLFLGAVIDGSVTLAAPAIDAWDGDIGLGTAAPTDHASGVNAAGVSLLDSTATTTAESKVANVDAVSSATALTESGGRWVDGTATAIDLFLNLLVDDSAAHDNTITGTFTGTIRLTWINIGDK